MDAVVDPDDITRLLDVTPTGIQRAGDPVPGKEPRAYKKAGWFLSSEGLVSSLDARHHMDWLLGRINGKEAVFQILHAKGYLIDVCCRWDSRHGHGGPTLSPTQMSAMARFGIELWFDVYVGEIDLTKASD